MNVSTIIPPKLVWFQNTDTSGAFLWVLGAILAVLVIFLIAWMAARRRQAKEEKLEEIALSHIDSPISGAIPQTGSEVAPVIEERVSANQVVSVPPDEIAEEVESQQTGDDLTLIEGIGPALQEYLHVAGIRSYEKLSQSDPAILKDVLVDYDLEYIDPTHWPAQARLAAQGRWDELEAYKRQLPGRKIE